MAAHSSLGGFPHPVGFTNSYSYNDNSSFEPSKRHRFEEDFSPSSSSTSWSSSSSSSQSLLPSKQVFSLSRTPKVLWDEIQSFFNLADVLAFERTSKMSWNLCAHSWTVLPKRDLLDLVWSDNNSLENRSIKNKQNYMFSYALLYYNEHYKFYRNRYINIRTEAHSDFKNWVRIYIDRCIKPHAHLSLDQNEKNRKKIEKKIYTEHVPLLLRYLDYLLLRYDNGTVNKGNVEKVARLPAGIAKISKSFNNGDLLLYAFHLLDQQDPREQTMTAVKNAVQAKATCVLMLHNVRSLDKLTLAELGNIAASQGDFRHFTLPVNSVTDDISALTVDDKSSHSYIHALANIKWEQINQFNLSKTDLIEELEKKQLIELKNLFNRVLTSCDENYRKQIQVFDFVKMIQCEIRLGNYTEAINIIKSINFTFLNNWGERKQTELSIKIEAVIAYFYLKEQYKNTGKQQLYKETLREAKRYLNAVDQVIDLQNSFFSYIDFLIKALSIQFDLNNLTEVERIISALESNPEIDVSEFSSQTFLEIASTRFKMGNFRSADKYFDFYLNHCTSCTNCRKSITSTGLEHLVFTKFKLGKIEEGDYQLTRLKESKHLISWDLRCNIAINRYEAGINKSQLGWVAESEKEMQLIFESCEHRQVSTPYLILVHLAAIKEQKKEFLFLEQVLKAIVKHPEKTDLQNWWQKLAMVQTTLDKDEDAATSIRKAEMSALSIDTLTTQITMIMKKVLSIEFIHSNQAKRDFILYKVTTYLDELTIRPQFNEFAVCNRVIDWKRDIANRSLL